MEAEDKKIKMWLESHPVEKAPEGFTGKVMDAIEAAETQKQTVFSDWPYLLAAAGAVLLAIGMLVVVSPAFVAQSYQVATGYISRFFMQLAGMFSFSVSGTTTFSGGQLILGTMIIIGLLLWFDALVWKRKKGAHLFSWVWF